VTVEQAILPTLPTTDRDTLPRPSGQNGFDKADREDNKLKLTDRTAHQWYRFVLSYPPHLVRDSAILILAGLQSLVSTLQGAIAADTR
jgi:hypothetical protein